MDGVDELTVNVVAPSVPGVPVILTPAVNSPVPPVVCVPSCVS